MANKARETEGQTERYPECRKWASIVGEKRSIENFLEWCREEHNATLIAEQLEGRFTVSSLETLLREYFEIDSKKLEEERQAMIEELRSGNVSG